MSAGGLHVVGTERHESRRIDNQVKYFGKNGYGLLNLNLGIFYFLLSLVFEFPILFNIIFIPGLFQITCFEIKVPICIHVAARSKWPARGSWKFTLLSKS